MSDTAQLDASTAATPSQGDTGSQSTPFNNGVGAAPQAPTESTPSPTGAEATPAQPTDAAPPATPADKGEAPPASLTNSKAVASTAPTGAAQPKAVDDAAMAERREAGRWGYERKKMMEEMERMRAQTVELQQFREETKRREEQAKAKRWQPEHPEQRKFESLVERRDRAVAQRNRALRMQFPDGVPPEHARAIRQQMDEVIAGDFTEQEQAELREFDQHTKEQAYTLATNPKKAILDIALPEMRREIQNAFQTIRMQQDVHRDLHDPALKPLFDRFGDDMAKAMEQGVPYDQAIHYTRVYGEYETALAENARLKQQLESLTGKVSAATVQQDLAKGKAAIVRDINTPKRSAFLEAKKWARENNIDTDSDAFRRKVRELES